MYKYRQFQYRIIYRIFIIIYSFYNMNNYENIFISSICVYKKLRNLIFIYFYYNIIINIKNILLIIFININNFTISF